MNPLLAWAAMTTLATLAALAPSSAAENAPPEKPAAQAQPQTLPNLLKNGDFENGKEGWTLTHTKDQTAIKWDADGGDGRGRCFNAPATTNLQKLQQTLATPLADDRLYELSADVKCDTDNTQVGLHVSCGYGFAKGFVAGKNIETGKWTRLSMKFLPQKDRPAGRDMLDIDWSNKTPGDKGANVYMDNIQLREVGRIAADQAGKPGENLLVNGDFENGLKNWHNFKDGGFEASDQGFKGACATLKADKVLARRSEQSVVVPNEDALFKLTFKMRPENTEGGKYLIGVMFISRDMENHPAAYAMLPLPSKVEGAWLDEAWHFYVDKQDTPAKQMQVTIAFYADAAKGDTRQVYSFDNVNLVKMPGVLQSEAHELSGGGGGAAK